MVAVGDIVPERAKRAAERWGVPRWFTDQRQVWSLPGVDAVDICTPHGAHAPVALDALRAGKHELVEKPMASDLKRAVAMVRAAKNNG